ncbi:hypothetical protein Patl1_14361 [Pistacia atlantica]|uniref:Uncharacterized protein n=1 Tax=Pistacia atlantica TaxID=434234 RepID=A0ACC1AWD2_9ROSI|nr:hypothetical protein Patl1_14361 [Pistacia atlantica]
MENLGYLLLFSLWFQFGISTGNVPESNIVVDVGVVLDLNSPFGAMENMCMSMAISDFYAAHSNYRTRLFLHPRDSAGSVVATTSAVVDLLKNVDVHAIITSDHLLNANIYVMALGEKAQVPFISFSPTQSPQFIHTTQNFSFSVKAIAAVLQEFKWREVVLIHEDTTYGTGIIPYAIDIFQELGIRFVHISAISSFSEDFEISKELKTLITLMQTRVFLVHMTVSFGSRLFELADKAGMMSKGYVWLITDGMSNSLDALDLTTN